MPIPAPAVPALPNSAGVSLLGLWAEGREELMQAVPEPGLVDVVFSVVRWGGKTLGKPTVALWIFLCLKTRRYR